MDFWKIILADGRPFIYRRYTQIESKDAFLIQSAF